MKKLASTKAWKLAPNYWMGYENLTKPIKNDLGVCVQDDLLPGDTLISLSRDLPTGDKHGKSISLFRDWKVMKSTVSLIHLRLAVRDSYEDPHNKLQQKWSRE